MGKTFEKNGKMNFNWKRGRDEKERRMVKMDFIETYFFRREIPFQSYYIGMKGNLKRKMPKYF